jgi:hypothetical protein
MWIAAMSLKNMRFFLLIVLSTSTYVMCLNFPAGFSLINFFFFNNLSAKLVYSLQHCNMELYSISKEVFKIFYTAGENTTMR